MSYVRFHHRVRAWPGVWFNLAKRGVSASVGIAGLLTVNSRGRTTVNLPGTGLSYVSTTPKPHGKPNRCASITSSALFTHAAAPRPASLAAS